MVVKNKKNLKSKENKKNRVRMKSICGCDVLDDGKNKQLLQCVVEDNRKRFWSTYSNITLK